MASAASATALLRVTAGTGCQVVQDGACATAARDSNGIYLRGQECTVEVLADGVLSSTEFSTSMRYDDFYGLGCRYTYVEIGNQRYCGRHGPGGVEATNGSSFTWRSIYLLA